MEAQEIFLRLDAMADIVLNGTVTMDDGFVRRIKMLAGEGLDTMRPLAPQHQFTAKCADCEKCSPHGNRSGCSEIDKIAELMGLEDMPLTNESSRACGRFSPTQDYLDELAEEDSYRDATRPGINVPFREVA